MSNGHPWSRVKHYSLSEIGVFFRAIIQLDRRKNEDNIHSAWMGNNLTYEGLLDVLGESIPKREKTPDPEEIERNWNKLGMVLARNK